MIKDADLSKLSYNAVEHIQWRYYLENYWVLTKHMHRVCLICVYQKKCTEIVVQILLLIVTNRNNVNNQQE